MPARPDFIELTRRTCEAYRRAIAAGESPSDVVAWIAKSDGVQRPAVWRRLRSGGVLPPYKSSEAHRKRAKKRTQAEIVNDIDAALPPAVDRDPCPRCGVRRDIGCSHSRAPIGMML